jgi:hypothetical protein
MEWNGSEAAVGILGFVATNTVFYATAKVASLSPQKSGAQLATSRRSLPSPFFQPLILLFPPLSPSNPFGIQSWINPFRPHSPISLLSPSPSFP